ncbi:hypothetical protein EMIHUDRAFT_218002 [Emiliania huxleyi CCMP1516]|uniref:Bestrophin homolog n=2 Tax=Emiliania huxleyi TaxID=2903 RepID=A0A0D3I9N8_EMIH1|nr:hypothetical protein EMIHUDRAFT_218002 [Emiliania huxleyi CCMP1516]EOD07973.1 hypothetical protein EMIHUDRAFT_218002 [Emiliania huxleyi CCMP1516]|eukprot:XP_005760402.1 hypothetical protein EMIHUDRAFT_218002 [Emiliania huxleyi CCMP1516]
MFVLLALAASTVPTGARLEAGLLQAEPVAKERSLRGGMAKRWPILARRVDLSHGERYTSTDWLTNFLSIPRSHVLERIGPHLWSQTGLCALVVLLHRHGLRFPTGSAMPHTLLGGFLSLLLAFRTNMAYNRFYAGRLNWGVVKNSCSDLALYAVTHVRPRSPALAERLLALVASFPPALACRCCCDESSAKLPLSQRQALSGAMETAAPHALADVSRRGRLVPHASSAAAVVETQVEAEMLMQSLLTTPVPLSYSRHTSRFLTIWCGTLPVVLVDALGWMTVPAVAFVSWCLFGIEEIGHLIEQPFRDEEALASAPALVSARRHYSYGLPVRRLGRLASEQVHAIAAAPAPRF